MPSRSSSRNASERTSALNASAEAFSPQQLAVFQPNIVNMSLPAAESACFIPHDYTKDSEDIVTIGPPPEGEVDQDMMGIRPAHRLEFEKLTLGLSLEIEQLKQELKSIRSLNGNGGANETGVGDVVEELPDSSNGDCQESTGSAEAEEPDLEAVVGKKIIAFLRLTKNVPFSHRLYGKSNYSVWRESILSIAEATECAHVIEEGQKISPFTDANTYLWEQQNDWLYNLIWDSIGSQAMESVTQPKKHSAYLLWNQLETSFRRPLEEERRAIFHSLYSSQKSSDREYIKRFQEARRKLEKLGFPVPGWLLYDILYENVSSGSRNTIHENIALKHEEMPKSMPQILDIDTLIDELVACLPPERNVVITSISNSDNRTHPPSATAPLTPSASTGNGSGNITSASVSSTVSNDNIVNTRSSSKKNKERKSQSSNLNNNNTTTTTTSSRKEEQVIQQVVAKCEFCFRRGHVVTDCYLKNPDLAPERWRRANQRSVDLTKQKVVQQRQQQPQRESQVHVQHTQSQTFGRGRQKGNNTTSVSGSSIARTASPSPVNADMNQSIQAIARQFYQQMDDEV
ncbi:hypothetical protein PAAG_02735 [Paracoccidioides lutzii Pb01]|uniref:Uncharacterized protein n=1 Tax=Paracoccidioides lutzii (strain ATCC MYA-826 / Pb01) TaxID=502779 RepID=C1GW40_PARBA|nr:hypothetical protein PAAG_02735 [Paracoccidioides lutzii Pb01]EEH40759.1 hypothetical protein PAAG_02735 [Paracoccidioides lutzii Pb01]